MAKTTPILALPYPESTDSDNVPSDIKALAEAAEDQLLLAGAQSKAVLIPAEQERANIAYGVLGTADELKGLVVPEKGIVRVLYHANWRESVKGAARAAIFLKKEGGAATQIETVLAGEGLVLPSAVINGTVNIHAALATSSIGLISPPANGVVGSADAATGQTFGSLAKQADNIYVGAGSETFAVSWPPSVGSPVDIFLAAGTYDLSIQFKASSGTVKAKDRRLYAWTKEFA